MMIKRQYHSAMPAAFGDRPHHVEVVGLAGRLQLADQFIEGQVAFDRPGPQLQSLMGVVQSHNDRSLPGKGHEIYGNYYNAQGMFQVGGRHWKEYADWMYEHYLKQQQDDGSWGLGGHGPVYSTSMMVLAFTVPHRQLPIYQRDETVDEE